MLKRFSDNLSGATAVEYSLIAALIAVVLVTVISAMMPKHTTVIQPTPAASAPLKN